MPQISCKRLIAFALFGFATGIVPAGAGASSIHQSDAMARGFTNPPQTARPRAFWPWMNGNVTREGIEKDLAWMKRVGIAGVPAVDAAIETPPVVAHRIPYLSPEWRDM